MSVAMPVAEPAILHAFRAASAPDAVARGGAEHAEAPAAPVIHAAPSSRSVGSNGRLREDSQADVDYTALGMHLSPLAFFWIGPFAFAIPLVLWLVRKDQSAFADDHGREVLNFLISQLILTIALAVSVVGWLFIVPFLVVGVVSMIRGAVAVSRQEYFRYPMTIRFL